VPNCSITQALFGLSYQFGVYKPTFYLGIYLKGRVFSYMQAKNDLIFLGFRYFPCSRQGSDWKTVNDFWFRQGSDWETGNDF